MSKRYYWLKLNEDFFDDIRIKKLRSIAGGDTYTIIYLKMSLLSIRNGGILEYDGVDEDFPSEIALKINEDVENVKIVVAFLVKYGLIESANNKHLLTEITKNIGTEVDSAERVRRFRDRKDKLALQSNASVTSTLISNTLISKLITEQEIKEIFIVLWKEYPVKKGNVQALKTLTNKISGLTLTEAKEKANKIWTLMKEYISECEEDVSFPKYVKHFSTWLNAEVPDKRKPSGATTKREAK